MTIGPHAKDNRRDDNLGPTRLRNTSRWARIYTAERHLSRNRHERPGRPMHTRAARPGNPGATHSRRCGSGCGDPLQGGAVSGLTAPANGTISEHEEA